VSKIQPVIGREVAYMWFKHEDHDERSDQPIGPVGFVYADQTEEERQGWRPFDPNRRPDPWYGLVDAQRVAAELGVELRET